MTVSRVCRFLTAFLISFCFVFSLQAEGWRFDGTGRFPNASPTISWSKDKNVLWKVELPGKSLASPVVVGQHVFITSDPAELMCLSIENGQLEWQRSHEYADVFGDAKGRMIEATLKLAGDVRKERDELNRKRDELKNAGDAGKADQLQEQLKLLDQRYKELTVHPPKPGDSTGNSTSTPVSDGKDIFTVFATGIVSSHSLDGKRNWMTFIEGARGDHSASPLLVDGKLIVHLRDLVALNPENGNVEWRVKSDEKHGSPVAARVGKDFVLVTACGDVIRTSDGAFIAKRQFRLGYNSPIVEDGVVYLLEEGTIKALQLPSDIESETIGNETKVNVQWESSNTRAKQLASPVCHDGLLYSVGEKGILSATDIKTGENVYRERLDFDGGRVDASLCLAGGYLFVSSTSGRTLILRPGREFHQIAKNDLEGFSSSLAFAGDRMYIRTNRTLFCVGESSTQTE